MTAVLYIGFPSVTLLTALEKKYEVRVVHSGKQAHEHLPTYTFDIIMLDAPSLRTPGERICRQLRENAPGICLIHLHPGPKSQVQSEANVVLIVPITARRLLNSVGRLLRRDDEEVLRFGPFVMHIDRRILVAHGEENQLSPKQAMLAEIFMRHPGETIDRKTLMEKVWDTDYMGDTRTLDVHIRYLRKVMETDSKKPRFLTTVRGQGYRLMLPDGGSDK